MRSKGLSPVRAKWETVASQFRPYRALIARGISDPRALPASPPLPWAIAFRPFGASNPPRPHTGSNKRRLCKEVGKLMAKPVAHENSGRAFDYLLHTFYHVTAVDHGRTMRPTAFSPFDEVGSPGVRP